MWKMTPMNMIPVNLLQMHCGMTKLRRFEHRKVAVHHVMVTFFVNYDESFRLSAHGPSDEWALLQKTPVISRNIKDMSM